MFFFQIHFVRFLLGLTPLPLSPPSPLPLSPPLTPPPSRSDRPSQPPDPCGGKQPRPVCGGHHHRAAERPGALRAPPGEPPSPTPSISLATPPGSSTSCSVAAVAQRRDGVKELKSVDSASCLMILNRKLHLMLHLIFKHLDHRRASTPLNLTVRNTSTT